VIRNPRETAGLRTEAEAHLAELPPTEIAPRSYEELLHELRVHQIELEMQNDELRQAQEIIEQSRDRYLDLFDFAPVGYFTLNTDGMITEVNLTGAALLGVDRIKLLNRRFASFITPENRDQLYRHFLDVLHSDTRQSCELLLQHNDGSVFNALLDCQQKKTGNESSIRVVLTDISARKRMEDMRRQSEERYRSLYDNMLEGYAQCRIIYESGQPKDYIYLNVNASFERLTGLKDIAGKAASVAVPGIFETNPELLEIYGRVTLTGKSEQFEAYIKQLERWFSISVFSTEKEHFVAVFDNITKRINYEQQWRLAGSLFHSSSEAMLITDSDNKIIMVNQAVTQITGYAADEILGKSPGQLCSGHHDDAFYQGIINSLAATSHWEGEVWDMKKSGEACAVRLTINSIPDVIGTNRSYAAQFSDITEKKKMEETLSKHANFDSLTGLSNQRMFLDFLEQEIKKANRSHNNLALLFIDLDRFKEINDTLGHHVGDKLLVETAKRIVSSVRESDIVSRLGGDEFTVILPEVTELSRIENVAHAIIQSLSKPFQFDSEKINISASIGIAIYPNDASEASDLLRNADQAMYLSKSEGKNCYHFYTKGMQEAILKHHNLAQDLRGALQGNQFLLYFQPIVNLMTDEICKAETLLRWQHPTLGTIDPTDFIPIAEEIGLIDEINDWVFTESIAQSKLWSRLIGHAFRIGVNISPVQLMGREHSNVWINHVREIKLPGQSVSIEITEGTLLNNRPEVIESLCTVHDAGIKVAIDDFGTGYSSLSYLQKFKIDYLKIDQSFIRNMTPDSTELALSEAIIVMAHKLGIKVIAEGIETAEQHDLLMAAGCDFGQGYLFSKPVPSKEFEKLLQSKLDSGIHLAEESIAFEQGRISTNTLQHRRYAERRNIKHLLGRRGAYHPVDNEH
jgi:diguanylate cyclase (GGDEF)-like protein/PAS domain S-box-containing protein